MRNLVFITVIPKDKIDIIYGTLNMYQSLSFAYIMLFNPHKGRIYFLYLCNFDVRIIFKIHEWIHEFYFQNFKNQLNGVGPLLCEPKYLAVISGSQSQMIHMIFRYLCVFINNLINRPSISLYLITEYFLTVFIREI